MLAAPLFSPRQTALLDWKGVGEVPRRNWIARDSLYGVHFSLVILGGFDFFM
jgi:hypothetical protein